MISELKLFQHHSCYKEFSCNNNSENKNKAENLEI